MGAFIDCIKSIYVFLGGISGCIVSLIIIGLFAYALFLIISSWCHAKRTIFKFKTAFKKYQNIDRQALNELSNEFDKVQEIKVWKKFENNLVVKKDKSGDEVFYTIYPVKDFFDLNKRYFSLTDIIKFEDEKIELDILPKYYFKNIIEDLLNEKLLEDNDYLNKFYSDIPIENISSYYNRSVSHP